VLETLPREFSKSFDSRTIQRGVLVVRPLAQLLTSQGLPIPRHFGCEGGRPFESRTIPAAAKKDTTRRRGVERRDARRCGAAKLRSSSGGGSTLVAVAHPWRVPGLVCVLTRGKRTGPPPTERSHDCFTPFLTPPASSPGRSLPRLGDRVWFGWQHGQSGCALHCARVRGDRGSPPRRRWVCHPTGKYGKRDCRERDGGVHQRCSPEATPSP
jgi:hypothetical protein